MFSSIQQWHRHSGLLHYMTSKTRQNTNGLEN
jgi:hypothetical protein